MTIKRKTSRLTVWLLLLGTGVALGVAIPLGKLAVNAGVAPLSFVMFPALASGLVLSVIAWARHGRPDGMKRLAGFGLVAGLLGNALPNTLTAWLAAQAGASFTAIAWTLPPACTLALSMLLGFEPVKGQRLLAVALGLAGAAWLASVRFSAGPLSASAAAVLLVIPLSVGAGNVFRAHRLPPGVPAEWLGAALTLGSFSLLLPVWSFSAPVASALHPDGLPYLAAQVVASAVAMVLFFELQQRADAVTMSFVGYVLAATAVLLGAWLLAEPLPWQLAPAVLLIAVGFWLIQRRGTRESAVIEERTVMPATPSHVR